MESIKVALGKRWYNIIVGKRIFPNLGKYLLRLKLGSDAYCITNALLKKHYGAALVKALKKSGISIKFKLIPDTEKSKSITQANEIIQDIARSSHQKKIFLIAFGGGVVGDLTGFVASIYKRGIPYVQVPTTFLAQIDSAIGGKTAVDLEHGKNLVGAFYQPRLVFSDVSLLKTLPSRQLKSGLAEAIKYAVIKDPLLFNYLEKNYRNIIAKKENYLEFVVKRCSAIKAEIVKLDEYEEKGIRTILNLGHTIGHAIEAAAKFNKYNHGEAIALGMLVACDISLGLKLSDHKTAVRIESLIKRVGLPTQIKNIPESAIIKAHYHDKKFKGTTNRLVLIERIGKTKIVEGVPLNYIREALRKKY